MADIITKVSVQQVVPPVVPFGENSKPLSPIERSIAIVELMLEFRSPTFYGATRSPAGA